MKKLMVLAALLVFATGSAYAAEWDFYGSARVSTFYTNFDNNIFQTGSGGDPIATGTGPDTNNYEQKLNGNARIGANIKVSDTLEARFEYGALGGNANLRILWGEWNFGAGSLGIGQNYTPLLFPYSNQVYNIAAFNKGDHNMSTFGMLYGSRKPMIRLKFGGFQIAAVEPRARVHAYLADLDPTAGVTIGPPAAQPDTEVTLPSIQAKYRFDFDKGHVALAGGYQTFKVKDGNDEYDVDSYILGIGGRLNLGSAYFKGNVWGGQNVGNMADILVNGQLWSTQANAGGSTFDGAGWGYARYSDGTYNAVDPTQPVKGITDNDAMAALIVAGYEIRRGLYIEAGYGYAETELDTPGSSADKSETYYIQSTIFLAPGVFVTPEIGRWNAKEDNQPDVTYFGFKWQINF